MQIKSKSNEHILTSILPLAILFVLIQAASLIGFFHFSFQGIEKYVIQKKMDSCVGAMQMELDRISGLVYEWSAWDATAAFLAGQDPNYPEDNSVEDTMKEQNIHVFGIFDAHGNPVWTRCVKEQGGRQEVFNLNLFSPETFKKNPFLWEHDNPNSCITGYYPTEAGILMLCSRPVIQPGNKGLIRGTVIMARFVNDKLIASIARQKCQDFQWWNLDSAFTRDAVTDYLSMITHENPIHVEINPKQAAVYTTLKDIHGTDAMLMKLVLKNDIASFKEGWLFRCIAIYGIEGLVFVLYLAAFANKHCLRCMAQLKEENSIQDTIRLNSTQENNLPERSFEDLPI